METGHLPFETRAFPRVSTLHCISATDPLQHKTYRFAVTLRKGGFGLFRSSGSGTTKKAPPTGRGFTIGLAQAYLGASTISIWRPSMRGCCSTLAISPTFSWTR